MMVFSLSAVSADDLQTTDSGQVSGDVDVVTVNPWNTTGELTYEIPTDAKTIVSADVFVNVYGGSAKNTYGANANVTLVTADGEQLLGSEELWIVQGTSDGTVYPVNDHTDKCYSDYQIHYDIKDLISGLNGSSIAVKVDTFAMDGKTFDGRIKLIALVLAYDDGDSDVINYWVDFAQKWTKTNVTTTFETENAAKGTATLTNVALSSADGSFRVNNELIGDPDNHSSGNYYQYSVWNDISSKMVSGQSTELMAVNVGTSTYASLKNVLSVLKIVPLNVETNYSGEVSGDVDVVTVNPWNTTGELTYEIPTDAKTIVSADVFVNVYGGSAKNTYGANANVTLVTADGEQLLGSEELWIVQGTSDGTVYPVNDHTDKCYSDYQIHYDIKDLISGLNGSSIAVKVDTFAMDGKTFDGRIKLIALVLAYDDGDSDVINYWVDFAQKWTKTNVTTTFETENAAKGTATLTNVALSSADGSFRVNNELIGDPDNHSSGNYYQYSVWDDVSSKLITGQNTELMAVNVGTSTYASLKNVLSVLKIKAFDVVENSYSGQVSGDVDVVTVNPWNTTGELTYEIPTDAKTIVSADVYVNVYGGSAKNTYGANANVTLVTVNGENQLGSEALWIAEGSSDGTVYIVNDHTDKCYSDYQIHYDIKDMVAGLNGSSIAVKVDTFAMDGKTFDGRIKLIALVLAYDDGDSDVINYWVDFAQKWTKTNVTTTFETENAAKGTATLTNVALSSADGSFRVNNELIGDPDNHSSGNYYQYSVWDDVSSKLMTGQNTELMAVNAGTSTYASLKNVLSVMKAKSAVETIVTANALFTRYDSGNAFTVTVVDANNNPVKGLELMLKVYTGKTSKKYFVTTNDEGVASFDLASNLDIGIHDVAVSSPNPQNYTVKKTYSTIQVAKAKTVVKAPAVTVKVKKSKYFKVKIKNKATYKPVAKIKIKLRIFTGNKYKTYTVTTSKYGNAVFNTKYLSAGKHKVLIYTLDGRYKVGAKSVIYVKK